MVARKVPAARKRPIRTLRIVLGEVNIFTHPHSTANYIKAFKLLNDRKPKVLYHGQRQIEMGTLRELDDDRLPDALTGYFYIFSKINFEDPWLNTARNAEATEAELEQLNIPEHLAPEFRRFRYIFDPHKHRLFFEMYTRDRHHISAKAFGQSVERMLEKLPRTMFSEARAVVVPDHTAIEKILTLNKLRKIEFVLHRPNPDDDDFEESVLADLDAENIGTEHQTLIKAPGVPAIIPSETRKKLLRLASRFGFVRGWGKNEEGATIRKDTESQPKEHVVSYKETEDSLDRAVDKISKLNGGHD